MTPAEPSVCPECHAQSPAGSNRCRSCGYPLLLAPTQQTSAPVDPRLFRKPREKGADDEGGDEPAADPDPTVVITKPLRPVPAASPPVHAGQRLCPACGRANASERARWCEWCGADMAPPPVAASPVAAPSAPPPRPARTWWFVAAAVVAVLLVVIAVVLGTRGEDTPNTSTPTGKGGAQVTPSTSAASTTFVVDAAQVTARASSTRKTANNIYSIYRTLDGKKNTAWNSDGDKVGRGIGIRLTYRFDQPQHLVAISVRNGYVSSSLLGEKAFAANGRLRQVTVQTGTGSRTWRLRDTPDPQTLSADLGTTSTVALVVEAVYDGSKYTDLALTDIAFTGVR